MIVILYYSSCFYVTLIGQISFVMYVWSTVLFLHACLLVNMSYVNFTTLMDSTFSKYLLCTKSGKDAKLVTALPLADCKEGYQTDGDNGCVQCTKDTYQPTGVTNVCYSCGAGYGTVKGNAVRAGDKDVICKGWWTSKSTQCRTQQSS